MGDSDRCRLGLGYIPVNLWSEGESIIAREQEARQDPKGYGLIYADWCDEIGWTKRAAQLREKAGLPVIKLFTPD